MEGRGSNPGYARSLPSIILLGLMMLTAVTFAFSLTLQSLRLDEAQSLWETSRSPQAILTTVAQDVHVPLYHELLHAWRNVIGDSVVSARILSLAFFLMAIPAMYALGRCAYGPATGSFAAVLFTLSPFMNWYASEIRMYTLFTFIAVLHQYFFVRLFKRESDAAWIGYGITAVIGIYVHYFFFLVLFTEAVFFFARRSLFSPSAFRRFLLAWGVAALSFVPWIWYVIRQGQAQNQQPLLAVPTTVNLFNVFSQFLFGFQSNAINTAFLSLWPVLILVAFLALRKHSMGRPETDFFMLSVILPVGLALAISLIVPLFVSRYLIFVIPAFYLLIANIFSRYPLPGRWLAGGALIALMVAMLGVQTVSATTPVKEDYRAAVAYLSLNARPQDVIVISAPFTIYPIQYYYRGAATLATLPQWNRYAHGGIPAFDPGTLPQQAVDETRDADYAWLVLSYDQGYQSQILAYFDQHYGRVSAKTFSTGLSVYEYKIRYDTPLSSRAPATAIVP